MTKEELIEKVAFIGDDQTGKTIYMYVTTGTTGLQLFNIVDGDLEELKEMFVNSVKAVILNRADYAVEDYSTSIKRVDVVHVYDLADKLTDEMKNMTEVERIVAPGYFDKSRTRIEEINGIYIVIKSNDNQHSLTLYKKVTNVDKAYVASTFFLFGTQDQQFERQKENMLKVTPSFQMLQVDGSIVLVDLDKLEKPLHLDAILEKETARDAMSLGRNLVVRNDHIINVCKKPSLCKKLRHALSKSKVVKKLEDSTLTSAQIITFVETKTNLKFRYNKDKTKFEIKSDAEAIRFIKLMDDDYLMSELTGEKYDSKDKDEMKG